MDLTPVFQAEEGPNGNCFAACLSTILSVPFAEIPDFRNMEDWSDKLNGWARLIGWNVWFVPGDGRSVVDQEIVPKGWSIVAHKTLSGFIHSAVFFDGWLVHDPSPRPYCTDQSEVLLWTVLERVNERSHPRLPKRHSTILRPERRPDVGWRIRDIQTSAVVAKAANPQAKTISSRSRLVR